MTVLEVIQKSSDYLSGKGVESPRLQVELILAQVLQVPRLKLYLNFDRPLTEAELETARAWVARRGRREPLQHILGSVSFCGLDMEVNRDVLIPRPETEVLAEQAWDWLARRDPRGSSQGPRVLDVGTGSGCLAIAIAAKFPGLRVHAVDLSPAALCVARANAARHHVSDQIEFFEGDLFAPLPTGASYSLIASNPPYIASAEIASLAPEVRDFDPRLALDGGEDGLVVFKRLAEEGPAYLEPGGRLAVEMADGQAPRVRPVLEAAGWIVEAVKPDLSGRERILIARRPD